MGHDARVATHLPASVLIVEDDPDLAASIGELIDTVGYRWAWAPNGFHALQALRVERPAMMLVDIFMPVMNGSDFLGIVRRSAEWSDIPRVIMTGINDGMIGVKEDTAVLYKPLDLALLLHLVHRHCGPGHVVPARAEQLTPGTV